MKFLHIMDPIDRVDISKDTSFAFLLESQTRGHENSYCAITDLSVDGTSVLAHCRPLEVRPVQGSHWTLRRAAKLRAEDFDAIFMRKDPPFDIDFFFATHVLSLVDTRRTFLFNDPRGLREASEKLFILRFPNLITDTLVAADAEEILSFCERLGGDIVVKPLGGCGGAGVFRIRAGDLNNRSIIETSTAGGRRQVMAQRYLPESRQGDLRVLYLDGRAIGAIRRVPREDDLRGNIHVGGTCIPAKIGEREEAICKRLTPALSELGIFFAGLDIIGPYLTEVNVTSPTGIQEANRLGGKKLEAEVISFVESKCPGPGR